MIGVQAGLRLSSAAHGPTATTRQHGFSLFFFLFFFFFSS